MRVGLLLVVIAACGGASKATETRSAAVPVAPAPTPAPPPVTPAEPVEPTREDKVAVAEDPDAGGEATGLGEAAGQPGIRPNGDKDGIGIGSIGSTGGGTGAGYGGMRQRSTTPIIRFGNPTIQGGLDKTLVRRIMRRNENKLRFCYERVLQANPSLTGLLVLKLQIGADGKVMSAQANGVHKDVEACVVYVANSMMFPKPTSAGTVNVTQPITFAPP